MFQHACFRTRVSGHAAGLSGHAIMMPAWRSQCRMSWKCVAHTISESRQHDIRVTISEYIHDIRVAPTRYPCHDIRIYTRYPSRANTISVSRYPNVYTISESRQHDIRVPMSESRPPHQRCHGTDPSLPSPPCHMRGCGGAAARLQADHANLYTARTWTLACRQIMHA
jgi:hypothetical protein